MTKTFFGQPFGLLNLFTTEFCERFSYYGMRAILVFYLYTSVTGGGLGLSKTEAAHVMPIFGASVYLLSVIGGWLADRIIGSYRAVFIGGIIIAIGHILLGFPLSSVPGCFVALACIATGTGLLKPNVSSMVGELYEEGDRRRTAGFNLFVMGINLGSLFSPLIVGYVQEQVNFHVAFVIPAVFMVIGLVIYRALTKSTLGNVSKEPAHPLVGDEKAKLLKILIPSVIAGAVLVAVLVMTGLFTLDTVSTLLPLLSLIIVIGIFWSIYADKDVTKVERGRTTAYIAIFVIGAVFWAIEELQSSVFAILAADRTAGYIGSFHVPDSWYQSINPFVIVLLAPLLALLWTKVSRQPSLFQKMAIGLAGTAVCFFIPGFGFMGADQHVSPMLLIIPIVLMSASEMFISPVALSATTELAPKKYGSRMMALWFLSNTFGQGVDAFFMKYFDSADPAGYFMAYAIAVSVILVALLFLLKPLKKLSHGVL